MKTAKTILFFLLLMVSTTSGLYAQNKVEVIGKVVDQENLEMIGATVREKGATNGVVTDLDGRYKITVPAGATLEFAYLGMRTKEEKVNGRNIINVTLESADVELNEVVVIGYGTVRRGELTSSIASVRGKEIERLPMTDALQALSGRVAGLQISSASGSPDATTQVKIRGGISITQSNDPLYIIDGFPSPEGMTGIEPSDIESIDVMKDASATAIYGAAGANGVILITTKSGAEGRANINFDAYIGVKKITKRIKTLNVADFVRLEYERAMLKSEDDQRNIVSVYGGGYNNALSVLDNMQNTWYDIPQYYNNRPGVNWQDEVFDDYTPITQNYRLSVDGGTKETNFNVSLSHTSDDGIMTNSGLERNNIRLRFGHKISPKMTLNATASYSEDQISGLGSLQDGGRFSAMRQIIQSRPVISRDGNDRTLVESNIDPLLQDDDGNVMINPITAIREEERDRGTEIINFNASLRYEIIKGLTFQTQASIRRRSSWNDVFYHADSRQALRGDGPYAQLQKNTDKGWNYTNTVTYRPRLHKKHNLNIMLGQEEKYRKFTSSSSQVKGFPEINNGLNSLQLGTTATVPVTTVEGERDLSFFTRVNYDYLKKYLFSATYRLDGSSKFGSEHKWGHFPSASFAWRAIDEDFIKNLNVFSDFKVRFGVGTAGNNNIGRYKSLYRLKPGTMPENNQESSSVGSTQLANPNLKWETDISINLGLEFGFFDQRLQAVIDLYQNTAKDLLLERQIPLVSGYTTVLQNIGETENRGIEIALRSHNIETKNFRWTSALNFSLNKNKVKKLTNVNEMPVRSAWNTSGEFNDYDYLLEVGSALGQMWGWEVEGIYTVDDFTYNPETKAYELNDKVVISNDVGVKPGYWKYKDQNKDGKIDTEDRVVIGNANPKFYGGLTNTFEYKDFDFSFILNYSVGGKVYNANTMFYTKMDYKYNNNLEVVKNRFTYINERGENVYHNPQELARINENASWTSIDGNSTLRFNSRYVEDASYLRLSNIMLGYTLPAQLSRRFYVRKMRVYASANNLLTLTGYSGYDPEVNTKPNSGLTPGIDWGAYPRAFSMIFGVNMTF